MRLRTLLAAGIAALLLAATPAEARTGVVAARAFSAEVPAGTALPIGTDAPAGKAAGTDPAEVRAEIVAARAFSAEVLAGTASPTGTDVSAEEAAGTDPAEARERAVANDLRFAGETAATARHAAEPHAKRLSAAAGAPTRQTRPDRGPLGTSATTPAVSPASATPQSPDAAPGNTPSTSPAAEAPTDAPHVPTESADRPAERSAALAPDSSADSAVPPYSTPGAARPADTLDLPAADPYATTPEAVFGPASTRATDYVLRHAEHVPLTREPLYQLVLLLLTALYGVAILSNPNDARLLLTQTGPAAETATERSPGHNPLALPVGILGAGFSGLLAVRICDALLPSDGGPFTDALLRQGLCLAAAAGVVLVAAVQRVLLRTIGAVTLSQPFIESLLCMKRMHFARATLLVAPLTALCALAPTDSQSAWFVLIGATGTLLALLFLRESRARFAAKNVSFLHWILYLCTVEIVPASFPVLLLIKYS